MLFVNFILKIIINYWRRSALNRPNTCFYIMKFKTWKSDYDCLNKNLARFNLNGLVWGWKELRTVTMINSYVICKLKNNCIAFNFFIARKQPIVFQFCFSRFVTMFLFKMKLHFFLNRLSRLTDRQLPWNFSI